MPTANHRKLRVLPEVHSDALSWVPVCLIKNDREIPCLVNRKHRGRQGQVLRKHLLTSDRHEGLRQQSVLVVHGRGDVGAHSEKPQTDEAGSAKVARRKV